MFKKFLRNIPEDSGKSSETTPGNVQEDSRKCLARLWGILKKIPGNVRKDSEEWWNRNVRKYCGECSKDSRECLKIFKETLIKTSGNIRKDFGECSKVLRAMLLRNPGNVQEDSTESKFGFIL